MQLRPYQQTAVEKGLEFFRSDSRFSPIIVAPTGSGKSIVIAHMTNELRTGVLVLQPSKELLEQNYAKFKLYGGIASIYSASMSSKEIGGVTFATIGSLRGKADLFRHVNYVLIDECHLVPPDEDSMYVKFLTALGTDVKTLGLTATPFRLKKYRDPWTREVFSQINLLNRARPRFFDSFLHATQIPELYEQGYLCPVRYIELTWENGELKMNTSGAEYSDESVDWELKRQKVYERIPDIIRQSVEKGRKHRLVFVKSVMEAAMLSHKVPNSACVHAGTKKKDREAILKDFRAGNIKTVFNVGVLTLGFDFPALDTIIIARPTMSLGLFMQMVGRGVRPCEGKEDCVAVDMCGNVSRFSQLDKIIFEEVNGKWVARDDKKILSGVRIGG